MIEVTACPVEEKPEPKEPPPPPTYHQIIAGMLADLFGGKVTYCANKFPKEFYFCSHKNIATSIDFAEAIQIVRLASYKRTDHPPVLDLPECLEMPGETKTAIEVYSMLHFVLGRRF